MNAQKWTPLSESVLPLETWQIAQAMSANTRDGRVPHWDEAREYARGQGPQETLAYEDRRG